MLPGAFTGATQSKTGLLDAANGGYLFLDEIHRLSFENQEKLFLFMDKGQFRRLGENNTWRTSSVRFIFATTENLETSLVTTFLRRIPIRVALLNFKSRPLVEKLDLIEFIYRQEAERINRTIMLHENTVHQLTSLQASGNIGMLKNCIKISIANAYNTQRNTNQLFITDAQLPREYFQTQLTPISKTAAHIFEISSSPVVKHEISNTLHQEFKDKIHNIAYYGDFFEDKPEQTARLIVDEITANIERFRFDTLDFTLANLLLKEQKIILEIDHALETIHLHFGLSIDKHVVETLKKVCIYLLCHDDQLIFNQTLLEQLQYENNIRRRVSTYILQHLTLANAPQRQTVFALIYEILKMQGFSENRIEGIIVAHGDKTATSIAAVANSLCGDYVFHPFDMPIDTQSNEIVESLSAYLNHMDTHQGVILLVDMGSLQELYEPIKNHLSGELLIVNNLSTLMAIGTGLKIQTRVSFSQIAENIEGAFTSEVKFYEGLSRGSNIIISCISGIGIAKKIKSLFDTHITPAQLEVITMEYSELKQILNDASLSKLNQTKLIITTNPLSTRPIPSINLEDILNEQQMDLLKHTLEGIVPHDTLLRIVETLIRFFSMEGIKAHLSFLNPDVIINEVDEVIQRYESFFDMHFENYVRLNLLMHLSIMVERLIVHDFRTYDDAELSAEKKAFLDASKRIFKPIEEKYRFEIPPSEHLLIYEIVESNLQI